MKKFPWMLLPAILVCLVSLSASAQRLPVRGHVVGDDGKPLVGADLLLVNKDNGQKFTAKTDKNGDFVNIGVALGPYHLSVSKDGKVLYEADMAVAGEEKVLDINIPKANAASREQAIKQLPAEQRKQVEEQQKAAEAERAKIQQLNQLLAQAKTAEDAGNYDQAISTMKQATEIDSNRDVLWNRLAEVYVAAANKTAATDKAAADNEYTAAAEAYNKAIAVKGSEARYHNNLGQVYIRLGKLDQAAAEYKAAAQLDPSNAGMYYYNLGAVLTNAATRMTDQKQKKEALNEANTAFDKAIAIDPKRADAYYEKAMNLFNQATLGKDNKMILPPGAVESLNKYLELEPNGRHAEEAKAILTSLGEKVETSYTKGKKK